MGDDVWCGQAQNGVSFDFKVEFHLEGLGRLPPKTIGTLTKVFYILGPNFLILIERVSNYCEDKQVLDTHTWTHEHTDRCSNDNTRKPKLTSGKKTVKVNCNWSRFLHNTQLTLSYVILSDLIICVGFIKLTGRINPCDVVWVWYGAPVIIHIIFFLDNHTSIQIFVVNTTPVIVAIDE